MCFIENQDRPADHIWIFVSITIIKSIVIRHENDIGVLVAFRVVKSTDFVILTSLVHFFQIENLFFHMHSYTLFKIFHRVVIILAVFFPDRLQTLFFFLGLEVMIEVRICASMVSSSNDHHIGLVLGFF